MHKKEIKNHLSQETKSLQQAPAPALLHPPPAPKPLSISWSITACGKTRSKHSATDALLWLSSAGIVGLKIYNSSRKDAAIVPVLPLIYTGTRGTVFCLEIIAIFKTAPSIPLLHQSTTPFELPSYDSFGNSLDLLIALLNEIGHLLPASAEKKQNVKIKRKRTWTMAKTSGISKTSGIIHEPEISEKSPWRSAYECTFIESKSYEQNRCKSKL